jgi:hypothetical protein
VGAHISENNNSPARARHTLLEAAPAVERRLAMLQQDRVSDWFEL